MKLFFTKAERIEYLGIDDHLAVLLGLPVLAVLANVLFLGQVPVDSTIVYLTCYGIAFTYCVIYWYVSRLCVIHLRRLIPERERTALRIGLSLLGLAGSTALIAWGGHGVLDWMIPRANEMSPEPPFFFKFIMSYTLVIMVMAMYEGAFFFVMFRRSALEREKLARENMQAQLSVLKQQMNPHFLFNSLNTLVNIIPEDSEKATLFTQRLAAVYRRILEYRHKETITLDEELLALQDYIFLMQTRFEDKLQVAWHLSARTRVQCNDMLGKPEVPNHLRFHRIVPLSVQLLVENAIKHNVISQETPLHIDITLDDETITVSNDLHLRERRLKSTGWGHENLQRRYAAVTGQPIAIEQTAQQYTVSVPILAPEMETRAASA